MSGNDFTESARWLSTEYQDHNGTSIEVLEKPPSPLEFSRIVHISRPVIIKGFNTAALKWWTNEYLVEKMGDREVSVAVTPNGRADAITKGPDGRLYFVEPCVEQMTMKELLEKLDSGQERVADSEVYYLQSQNGNLFSSNSFQNTGDGTDNPSEFVSLLSDFPKEIPWCSEALGQHPDAVNLWIGDGASVTSIHSDPYENIYTVVRGTKHFVLLPPTDSWSLKEQNYPHAQFERRSSGSFTIIPSPEAVPQVRWSSIANPELPKVFPDEIRPINVTLNAGDTLYLPVGWWHYVRQTGLTIALNWWYDAELRGMTWVLLNFLRNTNEILPGNR